MLEKDFFLAGKAIFTVSSPKGGHFTYKVTHREASENWPEAWFVSALTGPDNTNDYTYVGMLKAATGEVVLTKASKFTPDAMPVRVVRWALSRIWSCTQLPDGYDVRHNGHCAKCGRVLTTKLSLDTGLGPICAGRSSRREEVLAEVG